MEITRAARAHEYEVKLKGRMDATWSDHVAHALADCVRAGHHQIDLDMAEVEYISSAGIRVLVLYARQLRSIQGRFRVTNASSIVKKVLQMAGLDSLLIVQDERAAAPEAVEERAAAKVALAEAGATAEVFELDPTAALRVSWPGNSASWLEGRARPEGCVSVQFLPNVIGIGLGALVSGDASNSPPFGEFLAAAGAAVAQPADGSNRPDYLVQQGALTPEMKVAYGMLGRGSFQCLLRFDKGPELANLPLSTVVKACLEAAGGKTVGIVLVAETASLIGASLQRSPCDPSAADSAKHMFGFPEIRDWLSFAAEPAFKDSTSLIVGFAASTPNEGGLHLLKPLAREGRLYGHFHAAAFPYRPLRKGKVNYAETVQRLFDSEQVLGLLHLLNDWREVSGAGESRLLRGACWCAPLTL